MRMSHRPTVSVFCVQCGPVVKPHECAHGAKVMKRASNADMSRPAKAARTSAAPGSSQLRYLFGPDSDEDEQDMLPAGSGSVSAYDVLSKLLKDHSSLQSQCSVSTKTIAEQKQVLVDNQKRESAATREAAKTTAKVERLQKELGKRDKTIADQKKKLNTLSKTPKGKATAATLPPARDGYLKLITDLTQKYELKADGLKKKHTAPVPATKAAASSPARLQILQLNTNPAYPTQRELCFMTSSQAQSAGLPASTPAGWFYDTSTPPTPWSPEWVAISDASVVGALVTLGTPTKDSAGVTTAFLPIVASTAQYTAGQHSYTVKVVNTPPPQAPSPQPPQSSRPSWQDDVLFSGDFFGGMMSYATATLKQLNFDEPDCIVSNSAEVAALAEMWSSYAQGFSYDPNKCELWVKPNWLRMWLRAAKERKYNEARILMHGMRSQNYNLLANNLAGFDFNFNHNGAKQWGFYASCSDHIASEYNAMGGGSLPDGTGVIGLLLTKPRASTGAYEHYHLGSRRGGPSSHRVNDAYAVRDQMLWLPLGLAYAKV